MFYLIQSTVCILMYSTVQQSLFIQSSQGLLILCFFSHETNLTETQNLYHCLDFYFEGGMAEEG